MTSSKPETAVEPPVLEALLVETDTSFDLDGRTLIRLDDGGVPDEIIDMLVALSFPDDFSVQRSRPTASYGGGRRADSSGSWGGYGYDTWYPYYAAPFGYYYGWSPYRSLYGWGRLLLRGPPGYYGLPGVVDHGRARRERRTGLRRATATLGPAPRGTAGGRRAQPRGVGRRWRLGSHRGGKRGGAPPRSTGASSGSRGVRRARRAGAAEGRRRGEGAGRRRAEARRGERRRRAAGLHPVAPPRRATRDLVPLLLDAVPPVQDRRAAA